MKINDWDMYFLNLCEAVALKSKDPSTQLGAVIVGKHHEILSTGFNGFPRGVMDLDDRYQTRSIKYKYVEHAERNAIYNAARHGIALDGSTLYCKWFPCCDCARAIIQSGISRIVIGTPLSETPKRWLADFNVAKDLLQEAGVLCE